MSVASSFRCIKISTCPSCSYPSSSSSSTNSLLFSASSSTKPSYVKSAIIRSSQTEGPIRRPSAPSVRQPSPPTLKPPTPPSQSQSQSPPSPSPSPSPPQQTLSVAGDKNVVTLEFQRQKAKEIQDYFKQKKLEAASQGPFFGFVAKNEISNGRWAMFGFAVGMLTEYATGSDFVDQIAVTCGLLELDLENYHLLKDLDDASLSRSSSK